MPRRLGFALLLVLVGGSPPASGTTDFDEDCHFVFELYAHALAHGKAERFVQLSEDYSACVLEEALGRPGLSGELLTALRARRQVDERVRRSSYDGRVQAHPLILKAGFIVVRALEGEARSVYLSSLVRSPDQQRRLLRHPVLRGQAATRSKHVLGGLAADIAFIDRKRSMSALGRLARRALERELGAEAKVFRVVVEPYCLHVEIDGRHPVGRRVIEDRKRALVRAGILRRSRPGVVPAVSDYRTEAAWRQRERRGG